VLEAGHESFKQGKETEHNWLHREQDIIRIRGMLKGEAHVRYHDAFVQGLRSGVLEQTFKAVRALKSESKLPSSEMS
jgi:CLIP-associating protein 1/2